MVDPTMEPRLSLLTIGVRDLSAMRAFYERVFGWTPVAANRDIVFFQLNGMLLALFPNRELARDATVAPGAPGAPGAKLFTLAYNVRTDAEVDALFALLGSRGVQIVKRPVRSFFGSYGGYVADVEGNLWEIACNPYVELDDRGNVVSHRDITHLQSP